jgi:hypothetical protein
MRTTKAEDREKRIAHCVALIADIRRARSWQDFERLSDAELHHRRNRKVGQGHQVRWHQSRMVPGLAFA